MKFKISNEGLLEYVKLTEEEQKADSIDLIIPSDVKYIAERVFGFPNIPNNIKSVVFPEGLLSIDNYAFSGQTKLEKVVFPSTIKKIGSKSFFNIGKADINIAANRLDIGINAFFSAKISSLNITANNLIIDDCAFSESHINSLIITAKQITLNSSAFALCTNLKFADLSNCNYNSNEGIDIPYGCFYKNTSLECIYLPVIKAIGKNAFSFTKIKSISIKSNEPCKINKAAFTKCAELEEVNFESDNFEIGPSAFAGCCHLKKIDLTKVNLVEESAFDNAFSIDAKVSLSFKPNTDIQEKAFYFSNIYEVDLSNVHDVGMSAFAHCSHLKKVTFPKSPSYTVISANTFSFTPNLKSITLYNNIKKIEARAFANSGLKSIIFPENLKHIYYEAFWGAALNQADFSKSQQLESIGRYAFCSTELQSVDLSTNFNISKESCNRAFDENIKVLYSYYTEN